MKNFRAFEKKRAFFLKENRKPLICRHDRRVSFDFSKIRVVGGIESDVRRDRVFQINADVLFEILIDKSAVRIFTRRKTPPAFGNGDARHDFQSALVFDFVESAELAVFD